MTYVVAMLFFSLAGFVTLYVLQRLQASLPFNPQGMANVSPDLAAARPAPAFGVRRRASLSCG